MMADSASRIDPKRLEERVIRTRTIVIRVRHILYCRIDRSEQRNRTKTVRAIVHKTGWLVRKGVRFRTGRARRADCGEAPRMVVAVWGRIVSFRTHPLQNGDE